MSSGSQCREKERTVVSIQGLSLLPVSRRLPWGAVLGLHSGKGSFDSTQDKDSVMDPGCCRYDQNLYLGIGKETGKTRKKGPETIKMQSLENMVLELCSLSPATHLNP